ncbi:hypothetical protein F5J12DRAFT_205364 [Pisolithus orientalis]|uniref:uncharacterized protein n=1 Tax=Pisolithus orientalis TaxID=936130 RepID=UPI0022246010|nr:uncharacterized protein F5J12DRAFT_205364 [Pisolithus orientalis]KAI6033266.1 hypothetical protein F5J12DRAFT_205364 [Pisolithus orientalis]
MTEYDFSPAAYERYVAQQTRVSSWVRDTNKHKWSNPYILSPTPRDRTFYDSPDDDDTVVLPRTKGHVRSRTLRSYESTSSSSRPSYSYTRLPTYPDPPRQVDHRERELRQPPSRHRSQSHPRPPPAQQTFQTAYPQRTAHAHSYPQYQGPTGSHTRHYGTPGSYSYQYPTGRGTTPHRPVYTAPPPGHLYYPSQPHNPSRDQPHHGHSQSRHPSRSQPQPYYVAPSGGPKAEYKRGVRPIPTQVFLLVLIVVVLCLRFGFGVLPLGPRFNADL